MVSRKLQNEFKTWSLHDARRYSSPPWHFDDGGPSIAGRQEYHQTWDGLAHHPVGQIYAAPDLSQPVSFAQKLITSIYKSCPELNWCTICSLDQLEGALTNMQRIYADLAQPVSFTWRLISTACKGTNVELQNLTRTRLMQNMQMRSIGNSHWSYN